MPRFLTLLLPAIVLATAMVLPVPASGETAVAGVVPDIASTPPAAETPLVAPVVLPRMAPELALSAYQQRLARQNLLLTGYSASTRIAAELPDTSQRGEFELKRRYIAPNQLKFTPVKFSGDGFVKSNVITRLLQSEVDHVSRGTGSQTAIVDANYKFNYKGVEALDGQLVHVFQVKPRKKRPGLFKGRIYLDVFTGSLRRAEGTLVKTPSFFVKKIEFVQDYADVGEFTFPAHVHSLAKTRLIGRAVVDVVNRDFELDPSAVAQNTAGPALGGSR
ncbi:MAG TPA: hypothetical protein VGQ71_09985 [Terriglobales bacterium]|nr:hypothetical protein [Terriglobales bacterium]